MSPGTGWDDTSAVVRFLSVVAMVTGVAAVYAYPWAVKNFSGREIGIYRVYDGGRFLPAAAVLGRDDAPVRVMVDVVAALPPEQTAMPVVLSLSASTQGKMVFSETLKLRDIAKRERNSQVPDPMFRDIAGLILKVEPGIYRFEIGRQSLNGIKLGSVDIVLRGGVMEVDPRTHPFGFFLLASGLAGFAVSVAREHGRTNKLKAPPPRWGRGADKT